jgi:hypothetical protein
MKIQTLGWLMGVTALISSASILACSQAAVVCQVGHAGSGLAFAGKYFAVGTPGAACGALGDEIGFESFHPKGGGDDGTQPDFAVPSIIAVQTDAMGVLIANKAGNPDQPSVDPGGTNIENADGTHTLATHPPYALGTFATVEPDADGFCVMAAPKPAVQEFPKVAGIPGDPTAMPPIPDIPELPAESVKDEWTNVKVYVTAAAQGTQFSGHLKHTDDACSAEYDVAGVWPSVDCTVRDADGVPVLGMDMKPQMVPAACCPTADPLGGRGTGSGINPDFPVKCQQIAQDGTFRCALDIADATKVPALSPGWEANAAVCKTTTAAP